MLIGVVDPSHKGFGQEDDYASNPAWYSLEEVVEFSLDAPPKWSPWTYELLQGILGEHQERDYISTTMLTGGCPRSNVLERKEEYIETIDRFYAAFRGTMVHAILEKAARPGSTAEARFHTTIDGTAFSCSPDLIEGGRMWDYKLTESVPMYNGMWPGHMRQLQYNRYVVNHAEKWTMDGEPFDINFDPRSYKFTNLAIVYMGPKGPKIIEAEEKIPYRRADGEWAKNKKHIPYVASDDEVMNGNGKKGDALSVGLLQRMDAMRTALDSYPVWPRGLEKFWKGPAGWQCPGKPFCHFPSCLAKRYPHSLKWDR